MLADKVNDSDHRHSDWMVAIALDHELWRRMWNEGLKLIEARQIYHRSNYGWVQPLKEALKDAGVLERISL